MYRDESLIARFSMGKRTVRVRGFYDGGGRYEVRFMPDTVGMWSFAIGASFLDEDITGQFECTANGPGNHGPVCANGRRFLHADGTAHVPFGTTCYAWTHQSDDLQLKTLETLRQGPFNKIRMCVFPKHYLFNENEPAHSVVARGSDGALDFDRFNPDYFRLLDQRVSELGSMGIQADIILFHEYDRWGYSKMSSEQDDRYLRYVVARLASFQNVWWSLANEYDLLTAKSMSDWDRFFELIQAEDPSQHLRSIHNCREFYDHGKPWVTHCSIQHQQTDRTGEWLDRYRKPVVIDECRYEGNIHKGWGNITAGEMVHKFWETLCRGGYAGHGETYTHEDDILWWAKGGTLHGQSPARIGFLRSIVDDAPSRTWEPISAGNEWSTIGVEGEYWLTYFGHAQPAYWPISLPEGSFHIDVIDAWEMTVTDLPDSFSGECVVPLPGKPHCAIRVRSSETTGAAAAQTLSSRA